MMLGDADRPGADPATLDDLFRRAGVRRPDVPALCDPPNAAAIVGRPPRTLTFAQADRAISAMATRLRDLGLPTDAPVAVQLGNTVESVIALFGVLRAGLIAVPVPLLWRQQDMVDALGRIAAKAIVTQARIGDTEHAALAMQAAVDLFPIRFVCAFGAEVPDGVVPLDDIFVQATSEAGMPGGRRGNPAGHVAVVTFDRGADGHVPVARNHRELIAGGRGVFLESGLPAEAKLLSTVPLSSFAGLSATLIPWLLTAGTLHLHHGFAPDTFAAQAGGLDGGARVLPAAVLTALGEAGLLDDADTVIAVWRAPERLAAAKPWPHAASLVDVVSFGEIAAIAGRRGADGAPLALPLGLIANPRSAAATVAVETARGKAGTLALRGPMVPAHAYPPGAEHGHGPHLACEPDSFVDTGFTCRLERETNALVVTGAPGAQAAVGGYRFRTDELDALLAEADPAATLVALPDALLGQRFAGSTADPDALAAELNARGVNPLIAGAFRPRGRADAA